MVQILGRPNTPISCIVLLIHGLAAVTREWWPLISATWSSKPYSGARTPFAIFWDYICIPLLIGSVFIKPALNNNLTEKRLVYVGAAFGISTVCALSAWDWSRGNEVVTTMGVKGLVFSALDGVLIMAVVEIEEYLKKRKTKGENEKV